MYPQNCVLFASCSLIAILISTPLTMITLFRSTSGLVIRLYLLALVPQSRPYHTDSQMDKAMWQNSWRVERVILNGLNPTAATTTAKLELGMCAIKKAGACIEYGTGWREKC